MGSWLNIAWERIWPLLVPAFLVILLYALTSWFGIWHYLHYYVHITVLVLFGGLLAAALVPLRKWRAPSELEVLRRIERQSHLANRPITAIEDDLELGKSDQNAQLLWNAHRQRMASQIKHVTSGTPGASGQSYDRFGLRYYFPILAFIAFMSSSATGGRLIDGFEWQIQPHELLSRFDIWVDPPTYTKKPPVYLVTKPQIENKATDGENPKPPVISVPQFSVLTGRYEGSENLALLFDNGTNTTTLPNNQSGDNEAQYSYKLEQNGTLIARSKSGVLKRWEIKIIKDTAPHIAFVKKPEASLAGSLQLNYKVEDDYGVVRAWAIVEPQDDDENRETVKANLFPSTANPEPLVENPKIDLSLPRQRAKSGSARINRDLSKHPLAGGRVRIKLVAQDDAGQQGESAWHTMILPGRLFSNPMSLALVEQRRILSLDTHRQPLVRDLLDVVSGEDHYSKLEAGALLALNVARRRLIDAKNSDDLKSVTQLMWDIALGIEFGKLSDAERRLREAQERLSKALEKGASDQEISKLMKELRQAMQDMMQALSEQSDKNRLSQDPMFGDENIRSLSQKDLENMMQRIEDLAKSGAKDAAKQLLSELQRMMDNLSAGRHARQNQQEGNQFNKSLDRLSNLMRKQQELMNETHRLDQMRKRQRGQKNQQDSQKGKKANPQRKPGENQDQNNKQLQEMSDQLRQQQQALEKDLNDLKQQLKDLGLEPDANFDEAGKQMGQAGEKLGKGKSKQALGNQGQALQALKKGARSMMQQMAGDRQQGGQQIGDGQRGQGNRRMGRDPLGRRSGMDGTEFDEDTKLPGEIDAQRAREILEAIRDKLSEPQQRALEKRYLERLLQDR